MTKIHLMFAVMLCATGAQLASAQTHSAKPQATSAQISEPAAQYGDNSGPASVETQPSAMADPVMEVPGTDRAGENQRSSLKDEQSSTADPQNDPGKSPYWEPKDWNYIFITAP